MKRCNQCGRALPDDYAQEVCGACDVLLENLRIWQAGLCEASGEDWACTARAETKKFGKLCLAHYAQLNRGRELAPVRGKPSTLEMFEGWARIMREHGWAVIPPKEGEDGEA